MSCSLFNSLHINIIEDNGIYRVFADWDNHSSLILHATDSAENAINYANTMGELWDVGVYINPFLREKLNNPKTYNKKNNRNKNTTVCQKRNIESFIDNFDFDEE